jgi:hypothetical protein
MTEVTQLYMETSLAIVIMCMHGAQYVVPKTHQAEDAICECMYSSHTLSWLLVYCKQHTSMCFKCGKQIK